MEGWVIIRLNNFLYNAGILGFTRMLEKSEVPQGEQGLYLINNSELHINPSLFLDEQYDIANMYFNALKKDFEDITTWKTFADLYNELQFMQISTEDEINKLIKIVKEKFINDLEKRNSYLSGNEILKSKGIDKFDLLISIKDLKNEKDIDRLREKVLLVSKHIR